MLFSLFQQFLNQKFKSKFLQHRYPLLLTTVLDYFTSQSKIYVIPDPGNLINLNQLKFSLYTIIIKLCICKEREHNFSHCHPHTKFIYENSKTSTSYRVVAIAKIRLIPKYLERLRTVNFIQVQSQQIGVSRLDRLFVRVKTEVFILNPESCKIILLLQVASSSICYI